MPEIGSAAVVPTAPGQLAGAEAIEVFISYAREDKAACAVLVDHLSMLRRQGQIRDWHDGKLLAGDDWNHVIYQKMQTADIVLLLVSRHFLASDFCYGVELRHALERHARGETRIVPIILSPCDLLDVPFMKLQALPEDAKPITQWHDLDAAWADVVGKLRTLVEVVQETLEEKKAPGQRRARKAAEDGEQLRTILSAYSRLSQWGADLRDFFGSVAGAGGLRRVFRTFTTLTFRFDSFIAYVLSSGDTEANRQRYLGPAVCIGCFVAMLLGMVFFVQQLGVGKGFFAKDALNLAGLSLFGLVYFSFALRLLSEKKRSFGEYLAICGYVAGGLGIPWLVIIGFLLALMLAARLFLAFAGMALYMAILVVAVIASAVIIPMIVMRGLQRFLGRFSRARLVGLIATLYLFVLIGVGVTQPGNVALIGSLYCQGVNRPDCAERLSKLAIKLQPQSENVWISRIGTLIMHEEIKEARELAEEATALHPHSMMLHYMLAKTLARDRPEKAAEEFRIAWTLDSTSVDLANDLGQFYLNQKKYPELLEHCRKVLEAEHFPARVKTECNVRVAIALTRTQRYGEAIPYLMSALAMQTQAGDLAGKALSLNLLGRAYSGNGDYSKSLEHTREALAIYRQLHDFAGQAVALDNLGVVLARNGQASESIERYREEAALHLSRSPRDLQEAQESLESAFSVALRNKLFALAESLLAELGTLDPPAHQLARWRAQLAWYTGAPDVLSRYTQLAQLGAELPAKSRAKMMAIAAAGEQRVHHGAQWRGCPGVVITEVFEDTQARSLGLLVGDVVLSYQGRCVAESAELVDATGKTLSSQPVTVEYWRKDQARTLTAQGGRLGLFTTSF